MGFLKLFLCFASGAFFLWGLSPELVAQRVDPAIILPERPLSLPNVNPALNTTFGPVTNANGYYPYVIARPQDRQAIRNTPIQQRPTRPMHFYGNRVRKSYSVGPTHRGLRTSRPVSIPVVQRRW